jgi:hypothetical protein
VPEGILANDEILPLGAECDNCNQYASKLETAFVFHNRIWVPIMLARVPGKNSKLRKRMAYYEANDETRKFLVTFRDKWVREENGKNVIYWPNPKEYCNLKFRRALYHIGMNYIVWKFGWDKALENVFDETRRYVRYAKKDEEWSYGQVSYPDENIRKKLSICLVEEAPGLTVKLGLFIDDFFVDVLNTGKLNGWLEAEYGENYGWR